MPERIYIRHVAGQLIEGVQRCVVCGEIITDYRNTMTPLNPDGSVPVMKGFNPGNVYISKGFPTITTIMEPEEGFSDCKNANDTN